MSIRILAALTWSMIAIMALNLLDSLLNTKIASGTSLLSSNNRISLPINVLILRRNLWVISHLKETQPTWHHLKRPIRIHLSKNPYRFQEWKVACCIRPSPWETWDLISETSAPNKSRWPTRSKQTCLTTSWIASQSRHGRASSHLR